MLVFVDEAGDSGFKFDHTKNQHSSDYFTVGMVVFEDNDEAIACDQRIELLKREIGKTPKYEFHYAKDSNIIREKFFGEIAPYNFFYYGIVINKKLLYSNNFKVKDSFFKYITSLVFENAKEKIVNSTVIFDAHGGAEFEKSLNKYLKTKFNSSEIMRIKKIKIQHSHSNNLLQLADYVTSGLHQQVSKPGKINFITCVQHREIHVQIWPKGKSTPSPLDKPR